MVMVNSVEGHMPLLLPFLYAERQQKRRKPTKQFPPPRHPLLVFSDYLLILY